MAGFHVTGVDIKPQPRYIGDAFHQADAMTFPLEGYDLIWASPPCQGYSIMRNLPWLKWREYPMLIPAVRETLQASGALYVIENVNQARRRRSLPDGIDGPFLCGMMFGLRIFRHRRFEANFHIFVPSHPSHRGWHIRESHTIGGRARDMVIRRKGELRTEAREAHGGARVALEVAWMKGDEHSQAIPPAYAKHIGDYAMMALGVDLLEQEADAEI